MNRITKGSIITLSLLIIGLVMGQVAILAKATRTEVTGLSNHGDAYPGPDFKTWVDGEGKTHYKDLRAMGTVSLAGDVINITGKHETILNGFSDATAPGKWHGAMTFTNEEGEVIFEGHYAIPKWEKDITLSATLELKGRGAFEGMLYSGTFHEIGGNTNLFENHGYIVDTKGVSSAPRNSGASATAWGKMKAN